MKAIYIFGCLCVLALLCAQSSAQVSTNGATCSVPASNALAGCPCKDVLGSEYTYASNPGAQACSSTQLDRNCINRYPNGANNPSTAYCCCALTDLGCTRPNQPVKVAPAAECTQAQFNVGCGSGGSGRNKYCCCPDGSRCPAGVKEVQATKVSDSEYNCNNVAGCSIQYPNGANNPASAFCCCAGK